MNLERYAWRIAFGRQARVAHLVRRGRTLCATRFDAQKTVWRDPEVLGWTVPKCQRCLRRSALAEMWTKKLEGRDAG